MAALLMAGAATAGEGEALYSPYDVQHVAISGLRGTLEVKVVDLKSSRLHVVGPEAALARLEVVEHSGTLEVGMPGGGNSVTIANNVTVVTGEGASSEVTIGGTAASDASSPRLQMVLEVPAGVGLTLDGFVGDADIGDLGADIAIRLVEGRATVGAVHDAELASVGGAVIDVAAVQGDLVASVTGDGWVKVMSGEVGRADLTLTGEGRLMVEAPIEAAVIKMVGDGRVVLASVAGEPSVTKVGEGAIEIGGR